MSGRRNCGCEIFQWGTQMVDLTEEIPEEAQRAWLNSLAKVTSLQGLSSERRGRMLAGYAEFVAHAIAEWQWPADRMSVGQWESAAIIWIAGYCKAKTEK